MYQHLTNCAQFAEYLKFYALPDIDAVNTIVNKETHLHNAVTENNQLLITMIIGPTDFNNILIIIYCLLIAF